MLSATELLSVARANTGVDNYGDMAFAEGFHILVDSLNAEAGLGVEHEARVRDELLRSLENRLRMQRDIERHPDILDQKILPPVFITSLPRTGSTKLHRMLAASSDFNAMKFWQAYNFARFTDAESSVAASDPRLAPARAYLEWREQRSPLSMEAHPMYADDAEEELYLYDAGFNSLYWHAAYFNVPTYIDWVLKLDARDAFRDMRRILQYLQWQHFRSKQQRWVLKSPAVLGREAAFAAVFPGTDFIVTHRHPEQIVASSCLTFCAMREVYNDVDYSAVAGEYVLYSFGETVRQHLQWRDTYPADKVLDVRFADILGNEFELLASIYRFLGMRFTEDSRAGVEAWLQMDAARGRHNRKVTLAEYGLDATRGNDRFSGYIERYPAFLS